MAPSQMEHQQEQSLGQGYTHKKFNCSYSHKKLGMRLRQREDNNKENMQQQQAKKQTLFRPYALDNDTPRKRRTSSCSSSSHLSDDENSQSSLIDATQSPAPMATFNPNMQPHQSTAISINTHTQNMCNSAPAASLSPNSSYAERLQRQRAALYMRYMQQFHAGNSMAALTSSSPLTSAVNSSGVSFHPMGYPNVTAPIYNGCF